MTSLIASIVELFQSIVGIILSLLHSVSAVVQAVLALAQDAVKSALGLAKSIWGFVMGSWWNSPPSSALTDVQSYEANLVLLLVIGAGYYVYTANQGRQRRTVTGKGRR
jgi:hypothetical protein